MRSTSSFGGVESSRTETTGIRSVRIRADHQTTGESIVFQDDLVDDPRPRTPETNSIFGGSGSQEIVNLLVDLDRSLKVCLSSDLSLDKMVAVDYEKWSADRFR